MNIIEVSLISYPEEAELIANIAAVICYSEESELEKVKQKAILKKEEYLSKIIESGHLSIIEHNIFVFHVSGVSRVLSHQLVRKRIASYSQQSQRYVNAASFSFITPKTIDELGMKEEYENKIKELFAFYTDLIEKGVPKEDARYILPNATSTQLVVSMNAHALIDFFSSRCCVRAQWEIRELANKMLNEVKKVAPVLFKKAGAFCDFYGYCPEIEKSCGRAPTLEQLKQNWKSNSK
ncbi:MAG: FAD-dependent thymidylate synthase [Candidatus Heimdallarchaeaceae archaeon]